MTKAILFDLDNTLRDFMDMKLACTDAAVEAMVKAGLDMDIEEAKKQLYDIYFDIGIEHPKIFEVFLERVHKEIDPKILAKGILAYRNTQDEHMHAYPGVPEMLDKIHEKGIKTCIVTDAPRLKAWMRLTEIGLEDKFDHVITFDDTNNHKPSELPFKLALEKLNLKPEDVIMVGDNPQRDIVGAKNIGIKAVWAKYGWSREQQITVEPDHILNKPEELLDLL
jgi:putative hydrolase of the HAD superfamily